MMYKKLVAISMVAASLFFAGCGEESTSCRMEVQANIDEGNFDAAISQLQGECAEAYGDSDRYFNLATAYMGKAGFGAIDVVNILLDAGDTNADAFSAFTNSVNNRADDAALALLLEAKKYFLLSVRPDANASSVSMDWCNYDAALIQDSRLENACFYLGFNQMLQTTTTVSYLTNDVDTLVSSLQADANSGTVPSVPLDMRASLDALSWATGVGTLPNNSLITAANANINGNAYAHLEVVTPDDNNNPHLFYRLAKSTVPGAANSTLITDGYCDAEGNKTACAGIEDNITGEIIVANLPTSYQCYACPIDLLGSDASSVADLLVNTLNDGADIIASVTDDADIQESVDDFIRDIKELPDGTDVTDVNITVDDILNYLNNK